MYAALVHTKCIYKYIENSTQWKQNIMLTTSYSVPVPLYRVFYCYYVIFSLSVFMLLVISTLNIVGTIKTDEGLR